MQDEVLRVTGAGSKVQVRPACRLVCVGDQKPPATGVRSTLEAVSELVAALKPDAIVFVGDNVNNTATYETDFAPYFVGRPHYGTPGNHDRVSSALTAYYAAFPTNYDSQYYAKSIGPVYLMSVDSSDTSDTTDYTAGSAQALWVKARAAAATEPWVVLITHQCPYSNSGVHGGQAALQWGSGGGAPLENVDLMIGGHDHFYERLSVGGKHYMVNGAGAYNKYSFVSTTNSIAQVEGKTGVVLIEATAGRLRTQFVTTDGVVEDELVVQR